MKTKKRAKKIDSNILYTIVVIVIIVAVVLGWSVITPEGRWRWGCSIAFLSNGFMPSGCKVSPGGFNFNIDLNPSSVKIAQGKSVTTLVNLNLIGGATKKTTLSASGLPTDSSVSFSTVECRPTCSSTMTLSTRSTTPSGTYMISLMGTSGTLVETENYVLTVLTKNLEIHTLVDSIDVSATVAVGLGDANWDGMVDDTDLDICIDAFGTQPYMSGWNPDCDFNNDDLIDGRDVSFIAENYGETIEVSTTPFTIALVSGTYTLRAKYTDQIINKIVNVVEGTLTRVDILF